MRFCLLLSLVLLSCSTTNTAKDLPSNKVEEKSDKGKASLGHDGFVINGTASHSKFGKINDNMEEKAQVCTLKNPEGHRDGIILFHIEFSLDGSIVKFEVDKSDMEMNQDFIACVSNVVTSFKIEPSKYDGEKKINGILGFGNVYENFKMIRKEIRKKTREVSDKTEKSKTDNHEDKP